MRRRNPFPGVTRAVDRHGTVRWRFRKGGLSTYLPGPYGSAEFRAAYEAAQAGAKAPPAPRAAPGTLAWLIESYLASQKHADKRPETRRTLRGELDWLKRKAGHLPFARLEPKHVEALMDCKAGPSAANRVRKNLSMLLNYAARRHGFKGSNPARYAEVRKVNPEGFHTWTPEEVAAFLARHGPGTMARRALMIFLCTGAARQDAVAMGRQHARGGRIVFPRGKTGVVADLPILPELAEELAHVPADHMLFLTHSGGKPYTKESLGNWFRDRCDEAGLAPRCTAHGLRKWGATRLAEAGASENEIMAFLAHSTPREAARYTRAADRGRLADRGLGRLSAPQNVSNLPTGLGKKPRK